jgi:Holliday junction resolvase YEN1
MGIHGIYKEIGPGERVALSKLAVQKFEETGRPLRIAIDVSIWLFQIQASKGGTNPALRTFYYRLLRMISLSIHPIFVFDGPNKPPFKRNKRTGPNVASIPEFLAKQLLKQFGFPIHLAPGEAEAECALLQREGIVDAVLSEDVDTLMFGSGITLRNWSPEPRAGKTPTHVNVYDAVKTKAGPAGLDREGMILVALMSGGDYVPEGIPGCGPKTACEAARAGFGRDLCEISRNDTAGLQAWRDRLQHELKTNESKFFKRKHTTLAIPEDFPRRDILGYYTHPAVSSQTGLERLRSSLQWDQDLDFPGLRSFTHDAFDWSKLGGAKHFIRNLAPVLLVRKLRLRGKVGAMGSDDLEKIQEEEAQLVKGIHGMRNHAITDSTTEIRISYVPIELVDIDLSKEEPDDELPEPDSDDEFPELDEVENAPKKRAPTLYDPTKPDRVWVLETFVKVGIPLKMQDWEEGIRNPKKAAAAKRAAKAVPKAAPKATTKRSKPTGGMPKGALDTFAKVTKPGIRATQAKASSREQTPSLLRGTSLPPSDFRDHAAPSQPAKGPPKPTIINLLSSPAAKPTTASNPPQHNDKSLSPVAEDRSSGPTVTKRSRRGLAQRSRTLPMDGSPLAERPSTPPHSRAIETLNLVSSPALPSPSDLPSKRPKRTTRQNSVLSSPGGRQKQATLHDIWARAPTPSPRKPRPSAASKPSLPIPTPPESHANSTTIDTLDLTLSSSPQPQSRPPTHPSARSRRRSPPTTRPRPPLQSISSNLSQTSAEDASTISASTSRRKSPRFSKPKSTFTTTTTPDTLDLTISSSPVPPSLHTQTHTIITSTTTIPLTTLSPSRTPPRRSPRSHNKPAPAKKKRAIALRKSLVGAWEYVDEEGSPVKTGGAARRRRWRESEVEVLDLVD